MDIITNPVSYPIIVVAITQILKKILERYDWYLKEATPVVAIGVGLILGYFAKVDVMTSLAVGLSAVGLYEVGKTSGGEVVKRLTE